MPLSAIYNERRFPLECSASPFLPPLPFVIDIRRTDRPALRKAGNLRHAFSVTSGEAFVVFDADFCPRPDFLLETIPYLSDPSVGILQTPQFFSRRSEQTWVEQGAGVCQELFYRMEQVIRLVICCFWFRDARNEEGGFRDRKRGLGRVICTAFFLGGAS